MIILVFSDIDLVGTNNNDFCFIYLFITIMYVIYSLIRKN